MRTALAFLTRLPVGWPADPNLNRAAPFFGLVGLLVGGIAAGVRALADQVMPVTPATLLAVLAAILITGGLHEDGLADVADAVGAHTSKERRLEILKDPRVGTFGALALIIAVALTTTSVAALDSEHAARALIAAHVLARTAILPVSRLLKPAKPGGAGALLRVGTLPALIGVAIGVAIAAVAAPWGLPAAVVAMAVMALVLQRAIGGVTGDGYGATAKLTEVFVCVALAAVWS